MPSELWVFSVWLVGQTICLALCECHVLFFFILGVVFSLAPGGFLMHALINTLLNTQWRYSEEPPEFFFCAIFSFVFLSFKLLLLLFPQTLIIISSTQAICGTLPKFSFSVLWSLAGNWGNLLTLFLSHLSGIIVFYWQMFSVFNTSVSGIFWFLVVSGRRVDPVPVIPFWPEAKILLIIFKIKNRYILIFK